MLRLGSLTVVLVSLWHAKTVEAFVPDRNGRSSLGRKQSKSFALHARYTPPVPLPPPPPPPPHQPDMVEQLSKDVSHFFESLGLPKLDTNLDLSAFKEQIQAMGANLEHLVELPKLEQLGPLKEQIQSLDADILAKLDQVARSLEAGLLTDYPTIQPLYEKVTAWTAPLLASHPSLSIALSTVVSYLLVSQMLSFGQAPPPLAPYPMGKYDPITARAYFDQRPLQVLTRGLEIAVLSLQFGVQLLKDKIDDQFEERSAQRGEELARLLTRLGPTFIKVGQSLSIRTDLLSPGYVRGLALLQDQVPPFDTKAAREILEAEWGRPLGSVIEGDLTEKPVAAASLGQVYKAKLKGSDQEVAIKVQRPAILEQIALDMHLLREAAPVAKRSFNLNSDTVGTVDSWATGFVAELDYIQEAKNAEFFSAKIKETPLRDVVFAPAVFNDISTRSVLVSEWVDGERLDRSSSEDVTVLCSIAMNAYLTMMLELGVLHCDPHPGNLLRDKKGRLCILDWGMVTELDPKLRLTLIEHMAHLTSADYAEIPRDLLLLGFIPENKADLIADSGVVELLSDIYGAWTKGGGVGAINVNVVVGQLQDLTAEKGNLFQIPPYFAYIAKSFSVLEGIGLSNYPKYSIINECLPYVSQRLLTDKQNMGPALSTFIFGPEKGNIDTRFVDYKRIEQLVTGFGNYTTSASGGLLGREDSTRMELLEGAADQILDMVFTEEESPLQEIFLEQLAKIITSSSRTIFSDLKERSGVLPSGRTVLGTIVDPFGLFRTSPLVRMNALDESTVETTRKLVALAQKQIQASEDPAFDLSNLSREEAMDLASILVRKVWSKRMGVFQTGNRFARKLLTLTADKLERGDRELLTVPAPALKATAEPVTQSLPQSKGVETNRLQEARRLLSDLQNENEEAMVDVPEAVPAKIN